MNGLTVAMDPSVLLNEETSEQIQNNINKYFPYLMEARKRVTFIAIIFLVSGMIGFIYFETLIRYALDLLNFTGVNIVLTSPFEYFTVAMNAGLICGVIIAFPLIVYQVLAYIKPALSSKEYKMTLTIIPLSLVLFSAGFLYGVLIMKYVIGIFYEKSLQLEIGNILSLDLLMSKIILTGIFLGLAFQFPLVLTLLMRLKIIKFEHFTKQRMLAYSTTIIFAALLPPTDLVSLALLTLPLILLFELTLFINKVLLKSHKLT